LTAKPFAAQIHSETQARTLALKKSMDHPRHHLRRVGDDPASMAYVRMKGQKAEELGIKSDTIVLDEKTSQPISWR